METPTLPQAPLGHMYRAEIERLASGYMDEYGDYHATQPRAVIRIRKYKILRRTPKGAWIDTPYGEKFVLVAAKKRYASDTEQDALVALQRRTTHRIRHLQREVTLCQDALAKITGYIERQERYCLTL